MKTNQISLSGGKAHIQCSFINDLVALPVFQPDNFDQTIITPRHMMLASINYMTMHKRVMHAGRDQVLKTCEQADIKLSNVNDHTCEACLRAKATDYIPKGTHPVTTTPLQFIRVDVISHNKPGHMGARYAVHFICDVSGYHWVKFCANKGDAYVIVTQFKKWIELQTGLKIKIISLDGGPEFGFNTIEFQKSKLVEWARTEGVQLYKTPAHTPWMNGKTERAGHTIMTRARALMLDLGIPEHLWPLVVQAVVMVLNITPTKSNPDNKTPHEIFTRAIPGFPADQIKPRLDHLRSFFCTAYYFIKPERRTKGDKFQERARRGKFLGYDDNYGKICWIWDPETGAIIRASAVKFIEDDDKPKDPAIEAIPHGVFFSDQSIEEIKEVVDSGVTVWVTATGSYQRSPAEFLNQQNPNQTANNDKDQQKKVSFTPFYPNPNYPTPEATPAPENTPRSPTPSPPSSSPPPIDTVPLEPTQHQDEPMRSIEQEEETQHGDLVDLEDLDEEAPIPPHKFPDQEAEEMTTTPNSPTTEVSDLPPPQPPPAIQFSVTPKPPPRPPNSPVTAIPFKINRQVTGTPRVSEPDISSLTLDSPTPAIRQQPQTQQTTEESQPSEEADSSATSEVREGRPRRSAAVKPPNFKYGRQSVVDSNNNVVERNVKLFHGTAEARHVTRPPQYCLTAMKAIHDLQADANNRSIPKNYWQAMKLHNYKTYWFPAMEKQVKALEDQGVYRLVERIPDMEVLPGKWVYARNITSTTKSTLHEPDG